MVCATTATAAATANLDSRFRGNDDAKNGKFACIDIRRWYSLGKYRGLFWFCHNPRIAGGVFQFLMTRAGAVGKYGENPSLTRSCKRVLSPGIVTGRMAGKAILLREARKPEDRPARSYCFDFPRERERRRVCAAAVLRDWLCQTRSPTPARRREFSF